MKDIEIRLICELVKNSRRSDRELAKLLGVSQPTVSRIRTKLEKEGMLDYTAVPNLAKLGFAIMAIVFGKRDMTKHPESYLQKAAEFVGEHPNVIFGGAGNGLGFDRIGISVHKNYSEFAEYIRELGKNWTTLMETDTFLINLNGKDIVRQISYKPLANSIAKHEQRR